MTNDKTFMNVKRKTAEKRDINERLKNYRDIYLKMADDEIRRQASRCMDCGIPFCHNFGCPLGNMIPEWNAMLLAGRWHDAVRLLHSTNNFPEITGRICPALCEAACTLNLNDQPVAIMQTELSIIEYAFEQGWVKPNVPTIKTGKKVAVVGSGPAGLAAAQQLRMAGHKVVVFEKNDKPGGIIRYGIPDFKLEKGILDRRLRQMKAEGVKFETGISVGTDISANYLFRKFDAVALCMGSEVPRDLPVKGRRLRGIHFAMDYLTMQNRINDKKTIPDGKLIDAVGKDVVIIGGGDTGSDCLGTALRQGANSVVQMEILPKPPMDRNNENPWPEYPRVYRSSSSHEEGGERIWGVCTNEFSGDDGVVKKVIGSEVRWVTETENGRKNMEIVANTEFEIKADMVILAMGFMQPEHNGLLDELNVEYDARGNVKIDARHRASVDRVFAAGDTVTGPSLVVSCIAGGRKMAREIDIFLMGNTDLEDVY